MKTNSIKIFWNYIKFVSTFGTFNICCSHTYLIILIQIHAYSYPNSAIIVLGSSIYNEKCVGGSYIFARPDTKALACFPVLNEKHAEAHAYGNPFTHIKCDRTNCLYT